MRTGHVIKLFILLLAAMLAGSCGIRKYKDIKITSFAVESFTPTGLKSLDAVVEVGVDNPAPAFNIMNLEAEIYRDSVHLAHLSAENVAVEGRCDRLYKIPVSGQVDPAVTLLNLMLLAKDFRSEEYSVSIKAKAMIAGIGKDLAFDDIPLERLLKKQK